MFLKRTELSKTLFTTIVATAKKVKKGSSFSFDSKWCTNITKTKA